MTEQADFSSERIEGWAIASGNPFSVPLYTHVIDNLWMGGSPTLDLPDKFDYAINLYGRGYGRSREHQIIINLPFNDSAQMLPLDVLTGISDRAIACLTMGVTLVHCQAGLNRSGLITAMVLMRKYDMNALSAIQLLREKRCGEVLCNKTFERFLLQEYDALCR